MPDISFRFDKHGFGDVVHAAFAVQLFRRRGYSVGVSGEDNKRFVWKVAGVEEAPPDAPEHPYYYPSGFDDLNQHDFHANKVAGFFHQANLPRLGESDVTWNELCHVELNAVPFVSQPIHDEAEKFLAGLPRPIVCLHTRGTNWAQRKSLSTETAMDLQIELLRRFDGSIVVLDWDARAPMIGHERVRGIRPSWGQIDPEKLAALYSRSELMIGIDSGPFHFASMTPIKAIGVFREIHPVRCCIPNPRARYLVSRVYHDHWVSRQARWKFAEYFGEEPTATDIATLAVSVLSGEEVGQFRLRSTAESNRFAGQYEYNRVGHDRRAMELLPGGRIGIGSADCELQWTIEGSDEEPILTIHGKRPTCRLKRDADGVWKGAWIDYERMPIELIPKP